MSQLIENFDVGVVYPLRTYERHHCSLSIDGKEYKADYYDGRINWLNPHPKQDIDEEQLMLVEAKVNEMLTDKGVKDETEGIDIQPMMNKAHSPADAHLFKLKLQGEEFKGLFRDDNIEWSQPKPQRKLEPNKVKELEKEVKRKVKIHKDIQG